MKVNIKEILGECGLQEKLYPGKRVVSPMAHAGEFKSHCVVYDWRESDVLRLEVKAGLTGKTLLPKELVKYPVSFQSPTYIEIATGANENNEEEEDAGEQGSSGKGGGGGKKPGHKKAFDAFSRVVEGKIPDAGEIKKMVVMGKEIAKTAFESVLKTLTAQIRDLKITPVNILASVSHITKVAPGGRSPKEIDPSLLKGAKPYKPKDMFGANGP